MDKELLEKLTSRAVEGTPASVDDVERLWLSMTPCDDNRWTEDEDIKQLCDAAARIAAARVPLKVDTCSIINARSGRCSEDCKWCAQSHKHHTGCEEYLYCDEGVLRNAVADCSRRGVRRFSLVCSGRKVPLKDIRVFAGMISRIHSEFPEVGLCASMGLLGADELKALRDAGVTRIHCNLETAASFFPSLCTTHTHADKLRTIAMAREAGLEVCVGGIIGMGETMRQRLELAEESRLAGAVSLPLNLLNPIAGTPMEHQPLMSEREAVVSAALMRFIVPDMVIRFAGGRARLSREATERMLRGGVNGAMVGDLLTTPGNSPEEDMAMFDEINHQ